MILINLTDINFIKIILSNVNSNNLLNGLILEKSDSKNFLTKKLRSYYIFFNLIVTKIKMQQKSQFC